MNQPVPAPQRPAFPAVPAPVADLPLSAVQRLGRKTARDGMYVGLILALVGHTLAVTSPDYTMWLMRTFVVKMNRELAAYYKRTQDVEVVDEKEKEREQPKEEEVAIPVEPEPAEPEQQEPLPAPPPAPDDTDDEPYPDDEPYTPPAAAAAAAQDTLTADPDAEVDMTGAGWDIVDNDGSDSRASGYSSSKGKGKGHVKDSRARADGTDGGKGTGPARPAPPPRAPQKDLSRQARPVGGAWNCPFPAQADLNQVDRAVATISVTVGTNGRASTASVISDPGFGFGAQARRCALSKTYTPALDKSGNKITQTIPVRVRFTRR